MVGRASRAPDERNKRGAVNRQVSVSAPSFARVRAATAVSSTWAQLVVAVFSRSRQDVLALSFAGVCLIASTKSRMLPPKGTLREPAVDGRLARKAATSACSCCLGAFEMHDVRAAANLRVVGVLVGCSAPLDRIWRDRIWRDRIWRDRTSPCLLGRSPEGVRCRGCTPQREYGVGRA